MNKIGLRILLLPLIGVTVVGLFVFQQIFSPICDEEMIILIPTNSTMTDVKDTLKAHDLLINEFVFDFLSNKKNYSTIHPGRYLVTSQMDANKLINRLRLGEQEPLNIIFNNASNLKDLSVIISSQIEVDSIDLYQAFTNAIFYESLNLNQASMRKIFIPNTYEVYWTISSSEFVERMYKEYNKFWTPKRINKAIEIGLSPHEVSVLASIVQKESAKIDEQPVVAGLYLNRLKQGMKLQSDPTVIYALKEKEGNNRVIKRVLKKDLKTDSPYNTYMYKGLPPNPICIPEMSSLKAVLNPANHNYIYMCAKEDFSGYHNFTNSWTEHKRNAKKFQNALSAKGVMR